MHPSRDGGHGGGRSSVVSYPPKTREQVSPEPPGRASLSCKISGNGNWAGQPTTRGTATDGRKRRKDRNLNHTAPAWQSPGVDGRRAVGRQWRSGRNHRRRDDRAVIGKRRTTRRATTCRCVVSPSKIHLEMSEHVGDKGILYHDLLRYSREFPSPRERRRRACIRQYHRFRRVP
jgi:hypothetical protein